MRTMEPTKYMIPHRLFLLFYSIKVHSFLALAFFYFFSFMTSLPFAPKVHAQSLLERYEAADKGATPPSGSELNSSSSIPEEIKALPEERIITRSRSGSIFALSNKNLSFSTGDFITLVRGPDLVARALVAKVVEEQDGKDPQAGIKIVKIYESEKFQELLSGTKLRIIRGDDSLFKNLKVEDSKVAKETALIKDEDDLFNTSIVEDDDVALIEERNAAITADNIVSLSYASYTSITVDGSAEKYMQFGGQWQYQLANDIWAEISFGQNLIDDFPGSNADTQVTNVIIRGKYTFKVPYDAFIQPYAGFIIRRASSPTAGTNLSSAAQAEAELELVKAVNKNAFVFGLTLLKRLVPGWFLRADFGNDQISGGLALEF